MSWSDRSMFLRAVAVALMVGSLAGLQGCQVRPLYATGSQASNRLASVAIKPVDNRVAQEVRNDLIFLLSGGAGEPKNPDYRLTLSVIAQRVGVFINNDTDSAQAGNMKVIGNYTLTDVKTQEVLKTGQRTAIAIYDTPTQEFNRTRALRDAEDRGAQSLAELIRADVASALAR